MPDREKVIKAIEICIGDGHCSRCGYHLSDYHATAHDCRDQMMEDALALLKEQDEAYQGAVELLRQKTILFDDAIKRLNKQEWIPVTERLPEVRHAVLCYSPHHKNIWALSLHEDGEWYYWIPMYEKYNPDFEGPITHWMTLPEPPQEGR